MNYIDTTWTNSVSFRFLSLPSLVFSGVRRPGPASRSLYHVDPLDHALDPDLDYAASFQAELCKVHSDIFFLKPNALTLSAIEDQPLLDYFDRVAYNRACALYSGAKGPLDDLDECCPFRPLSYAQIYRAQGLIP